MQSNHISHHTHIDLVSMPHEAYLCDYGEDWAGVTNQKERRKLQNRLNQRARKPETRKDTMYIFDTKMGCN